MPHEPIIVVRYEPFGIGFDITVEPAPAGPTLNKECRTAAEARGYARGLRLHKGWPIRDETGEIVP